MAITPQRAAAAAAACTMNVVCVAVSHVAASDSNLLMSLPADNGTESPVCASLLKKERADLYWQPVGVNPQNGAALFRILWPLPPYAAPAYHSQEE